MKKTFIATLLICSTLFIIGCGQSKQSNQESNGTVTETKQEDNSSATQDSSKNQSSNSETTNSQNNNKTENSQSNTENQKNNNTTTNKINKKNYYTKMLNDIESKIDSNKEYDVQKAMTTSEMRETSGGQYKLWDNALNQIYKDLQSSLSSDDKKKLEHEELLWISQKESDAKAAGDQVKGGTLEPVYHTLSLVDSTKKRCYELVEKYMD